MLLGVSADDARHLMWVDCAEACVWAGEADGSGRGLVSGLAQTVLDGDARGVIRGLTLAPDNPCIAATVLRTCACATPDSAP